MSRDYPRPENEDARLKSLRDLDITGPYCDIRFDDIIELAREIFKVPAAAVTLIDEHLQFVRASFGVEPCTISRESSICGYTIARGDMFVIEDLSVDPELSRGLYRIDGQPIRFYAGMPIAAEPHLNVGALCILDVKPRRITPEETSQLRRLAELTSHLLRHRKVTLEQEEQRRALIRSQDIFDRASALTKMGSWERDMVTGAALWSANMYEIYELPPGRQSSADEVFAMHLPGMREAMEQSIREGGAADREHSRETLITTARGNKRWVRLTWNVDRSTARSSRVYGILQDITEQKSVWDRMQRLAERDALTGLPNRRVMQGRLQRSRKGPAAAALSLLLIDLDGFKHVNDTFGHAVGDECLKQMARRLDRLSPNSELIARMGGDEFALLLDTADPEAVAAEVRRVLRAFRQPVRWRGKSFQLSASIGIGHTDQATSEGLDLYGKAHMALHAAKAAGRNTCRVFDLDMKRRADARFDTVRSIAKALKDGQLELFYQPKILLADDAPAGFEALLRWRHPDGRVIAAGAFAAALEDPDLSDRIGGWVVSTALSQAKAWNGAGLDFGHIAINLSASQFREVAFADRLIGRIADHGLKPEMIEVEVTEGVFLNPEGGVVRQILEKLRTAGIRIALDDFGTGFASLSHLRSYPVDIIKLDRSFIQHFLTSPQDHSIVQATLFLARHLRLDVVAEGIEEQDQCDFLDALGCRYGQGWLFSKAVAAAEAAEWCRPAPLA